MTLADAEFKREPDVLEQVVERSGDHTAVVMAGSGETVSYQALESRSRRLARHLYDFGLRRGDAIAILCDNRAEFLEIAWAAQRSGLYYTAINWHLHPDEVAYILADCGARVLFVSAELGETLARLDGRLASVTSVIVVGGDDQDPHGYEQTLAAAGDGPIQEPSEGCELLYSSGTTGHPKAVKRPLPPPGQFVPNHQGAADLYRTTYGAGPDSVYLSPAPLYHSAPLMSCLTIHRLGGTVVVMERFDAEQMLANIETYKVTLGQFVPTMFIRALKLPLEIREQYDVSSLRCVIHASAPCPVWTKHEMINWWGPILHEYYGGTEGMGTTRITSQEWLEHPGSVGRPVGFRIHILDENGVELPHGERGVVYFESDRKFEYLNDPAKTASITTAQGWRTLGDVGYVDEEGYLYLTDRATFMIISGGVNIYPQEIENVLVAHERVQDAAVFGVPNEDMGEEVKAVVQTAPGVQADDALAAELLAWCGEHLAKYKWPRSIEFTKSLPRDPSGKLRKHVLREAYVASAGGAPAKSGGTKS